MDVLLKAAYGQDITIPLQKAILAVSDAGGGCVTLPKSFFRLSSRSVIRWQSRVHLEGNDAVIHVTDWQPFEPQRGPEHHATILIGFPQRDLVGGGISNLTLESIYGENKPGPAGVDGVAKNLIQVGYADATAAVRNVTLHNVRGRKLGSYLICFNGYTRGCEVRLCSATDQYASAFACVGGTHVGARLTRCAARHITGLGVQWTGPVRIAHFTGVGCRQGGVMTMNSNDNSAWTAIEGGKLTRCGAIRSSMIAGASLHVGGEVQGGRRCKVSGLAIEEAYGSGITWTGGHLKQIIVENCAVNGFGLGCGTDDPSRVGVGKESGLATIGGIALAGYDILVQNNRVSGQHQGYGAGQTACRHGICLLPTETDGSTYRPQDDYTMWGQVDCALGNEITGNYGEAAFFGPTNASDRERYA